MSQFRAQTLSDGACPTVINVHGKPAVFVIKQNLQTQKIITENALSGDETQVVYISKIRQMGSYVCLTL